MKTLIALMALFFVVPAQADLQWKFALEGPQRTAENKVRDEYRHPAETLAFFGLKQDMTVVEVAPGGGWYTEILAPLLAQKGQYYAAHYGLNPPSAYYRRSLGGFLQKLGTSPEVYDKVIVTQLQPPQLMEIAPAGSVDLALAFRNVHSWMRGDTLAPTLQAIHAALKPGAVFGIVQHRAKAGADIETMKKSGYVTEQYVIDAATAAGFELIEKSEINANPADTADHPEGVWTLPPGLRLGERDKAKYLAIGESDRMTLKFRKRGE